MKIKDGFVVRKLASQYVVVALSGEASKLNYLIKLNEVGAFMWEALAKNNLSKDELTELVYNEYDAPKEIIAKDIDNFIFELKEKNILENENK